MSRWSRPVEGTIADGNIDDNDGGFTYKNLSLLRYQNIWSKDTSMSTYFEFPIKLTTGLKHDINVLSLSTTAWTTTPSIQHHTYSNLINLAPEM